MLVVVFANTYFSLIYLHHIFPLYIHSKHTYINLGIGIEIVNLFYPGISYFRPHTQQ